MEATIGISRTSHISASHACQTESVFPSFEEGRLRRTNNATLPQEIGAAGEVRRTRSVGYLTSPAGLMGRQPAVVSSAQRTRFSIEGRSCDMRKQVFTNAILVAVTLVAFLSGLPSAMA